MEEWWNKSGSSEKKNTEKLLKKIGEESHGQMVLEPDFSENMGGGTRFRKCQWFHQKIHGC